jgi:DNA-binding HxlR family transcriptional regulator
MVVIRDLFGGACRYNDFLASPEHITTSILADRLKLLEGEGIVGRTRYQQRPDRFEYHLTDKGKALRPVLQSLIDWNLAWIPDRIERVRPDATGSHPWRLPPQEKPGP